MKIIIVALLIMFTSILSFDKEVNKVEIVKSDKGYQLLRNGEPFYIKGAGGTGDLKTLAEYGGNSIRTWGVDQWHETFYKAEKYGLTVFAGLWLDQERQGFDYSDSAAVRRQFESVKDSILKYKDHPSLLMWGVGNELDLNYTNPAVWDAVEQIAKFIHEVDGNHPVTTTTAFIEKEEVELIKAKCPNIDLLSINAYAGLPVIRSFLKDFGWDGPYILGEWGTFGHWEVPKTKWNEPIEFTSTEKAELYDKTYKENILTDPNCIGSYVFLWGTKQERTSTWYSMFLPDGEKTEAVDVIHKLWKGKFPKNRSPKLDSLQIDFKSANSSITLEPGSIHKAIVYTTDPDNDDLKIVWEFLEETKDKRTGGDEEQKPPAVDGLIVKSDNSSITFKAPINTGAYRLFVYVYDQKGAGAHANLPFYVKQPDVE